jgi:hypothetical protein
MKVVGKLDGHVLHLILPGTRSREDLRKVPLTLPEKSRSLLFQIDLA